MDYRKAMLLFGIVAASLESLAIIMGIFALNIG
jgi:hypothetical protein